MGMQYLFFRIFYLIQMKSGYLKIKFPSESEIKNFKSLDEWRKVSTPFFFESKESFAFPKTKSEKLKVNAENILKGKIVFFSSIEYDIGTNYDWVSNPEYIYIYDINKHWSEINDFSKEAGDIKYVWEKSRFSYILTIIRYDYHFDIDCSEFVLNEILGWIKSNPINYGPNYKCSQEISLRLMNWIFVLYYYKNSKNLNEEKFRTILSNIYHQTKHVYGNINFSRIAVRNNHAITETLLLYSIGLLFPYFPESNKWKEKGKKWFEEEVKYQVYEDGTFLQFSMNYHRVLIQLLTWAFYLSDKNNEKFSSIVYDKGKLALQFLIDSQDTISMKLPNYGANDGALFFNLNDADFRNYSPQINALFYFFYKKHYLADSEIQEDSFWYNNNINYETAIPNNKLGLKKYNSGGYYIFREEDTLTFIRCGDHKDRPSQADNLHIDIWYKGENILRDSGSYKYNTDKNIVSYFTGSKSHNVAVLGDYDQMLKGDRFIWYYWTQCKYANIYETNEEFVFEGEISAFSFLDKSITHKRIVKKKKNIAFWEIEDTINPNLGLPLNQYWNPSQFFTENFKIESYDENGKEIALQILDGYVSDYYGIKEKSNRILFPSNTNKIITRISLN